MGWLVKGLKRSPEFIHFLSLFQIPPSLRWNPMTAMTTQVRRGHHLGKLEIQLTLEPISQEEYDQVLGEIENSYIFYQKVMDEEKVDENGFIQSFLLQPRQHTNPPGLRWMYICMFFSNFLFLWFYQVHIERYIYIETITKTSSFKIFITIDEQEWIYSFTFYLFRNGSGDISTQENEAVVHIVLVEVSISNTIFFLWNWHLTFDIWHHPKNPT